MKAVPEKRKPESASLRRALHGLALPASVLRALQKRGIYCTPGVSLEHQHLAKRYVLRGVESGGAVSDMGRACAFVSPEGRSIAVVAVARLDCREWPSCDLPCGEPGARGDAAHRDGHASWRLLSTLCLTCRAAIDRRLLRRCSFVGGMVFSPLDLWKDEHRALRGKLTPIFYDRAGEVLHLPQRFEEAIRKVTAAVCCVGCKHSHVGVPPVAGGLRP